MNEEEVDKIMDRIFEDESLGIIRDALTCFEESPEAICCGKPMHEGVDANVSDEKAVCYTCLACGAFCATINGQLDDYRESYGMDKSGKVISK